MTKNGINVKSEIGVMRPSSFDGKDSDELTIVQIIEGPPEYRGWSLNNIDQKYGDGFKLIEICAEMHKV